MNLIYAGMLFALTATIAGVLGLIVFYHGPGKIPNRALSALLMVEVAASAGLATAAFVATDTEIFWASTWTRFASDVADLSIFFTIPLALAWPSRRHWMPRSLSSVWPYATLGIIYTFVRAYLPDLSAPGPVLSPVAGLIGVINLVTLLALGAAYVLVREASQEAASALREGRILMALGLSLTYFYLTSFRVLLIPQVVRTPPEPFIVSHFSALVLAVVLAFILIGVWRITASRAALAGRLLIVAALASGAADALIQYAAADWGVSTGSVQDFSLFVHAVWFLIPIALLAYVVLRGQIPGLGVKIRWGISRSTVAAAFVAAFFIASEGAQIVFGGGNEWVGLFAAGALVFAIAPLQQAAERLAEKAVPVAAAASDTPSTSETAYRRAVRRYVRDRVLTREEERELAHLAGELGLHAGRAMEIRDEVEHEREASV